MNAADVIFTGLISKTERTDDVLSKLSEKTMELHGVALLLVLSISGRGSALQQHYATSFVQLKLEQQNFSIPLSYTRIHKQHNTRKDEKESET